MIKNIAVIPGDGIGPEVTQQSTRVLNTIAEKFDHEFNYTYCLMGSAAIDETGSPLPEETIRICKNSDAILFGAVGHPKYDNDPASKVRPEQGLLQLRKSLQLFANIRPVTAYNGLQHLSPLKAKLLDQIDFIVYRELTGGIYFGEKKTNDEQTWAYDSCEYTKAEIERIAHLAFQSAQKRKKKLTLVDKSNVLETSRLWRIVVKEMAAQYKDVALEFMFVDNAAMQIIVNPRQFDIILTDNLFGDILSDEACVICGSMGLLPSASVGVSNALFEPIHGAFHKAAGKDIANPLGSILSAAMMLDYFDLKEEANIIRDAAKWTLSHLFVTKDIDPVNFYFTSTVGELICDYISGKSSGDVNQQNIELRKSTII